MDVFTLVGKNRSDNVLKTHHVIKACWWCQMRPIRYASKVIGKIVLHFMCSDRHERLVRIRGKICCCLGASWMKKRKAKMRFLLLHLIRCLTFWNPESQTKDCIKPPIRFWFRWKSTVGVIDNHFALFFNVTTIIDETGQPIKQDQNTKNEWMPHHNIRSKLFIKQGVLLGNVTQFVLVQWRQLPTSWMGTTGL